MLDADAVINNSSQKVCGSGPGKAHRVYAPELVSHEPSELVDVPLWMQLAQSYCMLREMVPVYSSRVCQLFSVCITCWFVTHCNSAAFRLWIYQLRYRLVWLSVCSNVWNFVICVACTLATPWVKKTRHLTLAHNFTKYWPIFKILSLLDSVGNL